MQFHSHKDKIIIVDFGSQVTKLIARRVRELGVYSEILTPSQIKKIKDYDSIKRNNFIWRSFNSHKKKNFRQFQKKFLKLKYRY